MLDFLEDDSEDFGEIPQCLKEPLEDFKGYQSFCKATESFQVELRRP